MQTVPNKPTQIYNSASTVAYFIVWTILYFIYALVLMVSWNGVIPAIFHLDRINYLQALALITVIFIPLNTVFSWLLSPLSIIKDAAIVLALKK